MTEDQLPIPPSPEAMSPGDTAVVVIDVQEKLVAAVADGSRVVWNCRRLLDGAAVLGVPVLATEQYPQGLGPTVPELAALLAQRWSKLSFSAAGCAEFAAALEKLAVAKVLLCGIETHVCVQQTALDLLAGGWRVHVVVDAVGSRFDLDHRTALRRMETAGALLTTTEAALFEWCRVAGTPQFRQISSLVREPAPSPRPSPPVA
jgi:nicotinamidase-related amidase